MSSTKSKYFQTTKRGEVKEWKDALNDMDKERVKEAVKKVIAAMTVGKDVSMLFTDVIKSMPTANLELKKLVYLYIINYARSQPDKSILVINTFQKDASRKKTSNPLIRALAIRTMGCLRVDRIMEHLCEPLGRALEDPDPYVRKTAAICVAKLFDMSPDLVEERGFLERLREMLADQSPMVVANAVAALSEISETGQADVFKITPDIRYKLLTALNECTEWGQVFILDSLAKYEPTEKEAIDIVERVTPRLKHSNSALVLSAIKVIMKYLDIISDEKVVSVLSKKLAPPLVTLLSAEPEIQYVALRNIDLIVQRRPNILSRDIRVFFCKYNDPVYVKMEKLEILIKLAGNNNVDQLLLEFKEYAHAADVDFVRKSVRAIGRCAIKLEKAAEKCIRVLIDLIGTKVDYVVQEAVIVIKDIFRRYPNKYEGVIVNLCQNLAYLDEPEAKASMIWIIGEYAERIEDAADRLAGWIDTFEDETPEVQLQLLTASVKLFLKLPELGNKLVRKVLLLATECVDNPDIRDRGYVYWRLLSTNPEAAKEVVLSEKPVISDDTFRLDKRVLDVLISNLATLSSVYQKPPENFVRGMKTIVYHAAEEQKGEAESESSGSYEEEEEEEYEEEEEEEYEEEEEVEDDNRNLYDEYDTKDVSSEEEEVSEEGSSYEDEEDEKKVSTKFPETKKFCVLPAAKGKGLEIIASTIRRKGVPYLILEITNNSSMTHKQLLIQFGKNYLGAATINTNIPLNGGLANKGGKLRTMVPLGLTKGIDDNSTNFFVNVGLKTQFGDPKKGEVLHFKMPLVGHIFFQEAGKNLKPKMFSQMWKTVSQDTEKRTKVDKLNGNVNTDKKLIAALNRVNVFLIRSLEIPQKGLCLFMTAMLRDNHCLMEFNLVDGGVRIAVKASDPRLASAAMNSIKHYISRYTP